MQNRSLLVVLVSILIHDLANAQGCSDAGVCTAGPTGQLHLWQDSLADAVDYRHMARIGYSYGMGEQGTTIIQVLPELSIGLVMLRGAIQDPDVIASGDLGDNSGIGDAIATASYAFVKERERNITGVLGVRIPTGTTGATTTDSSNIDRPLPMPYQTGLGTTDLLAAINWRHKRYVASLAYQHVLSQSNDNQFTHQAWGDDPAVTSYFESRGLHRADDIVARVQYAYGCGRLSLQPGLLGIYHVADDTRLNDAIRMTEDPDRITLTGSQGLTLNLTADLRYKLSEQLAVETSFGTPLVVRDVRPDGLTRSLVVGVWLRYRF
ncbi:MAG: hypothetical protein IPL52_15795 [Flavobacteriales bacterium]|nr:hypothetical protein [Flavobacteriales bacterium]